MACDVLSGNVRIIYADVPLSEMFGYTTILRGLTQGIFEDDSHDPEVRSRIRSRIEAEGAAAVHADLARADPGAAATVARPAGSSPASSRASERASAGGDVVLERKAQHRRDQQDRGEGGEIERLADVGVDAELVALHHVSFFARGGQHHDGYHLGPLVRLYPAKHLQAIHLGKLQVEQYDFRSVVDAPTHVGAGGEGIANGAQNMAALPRPGVVGEVVALQVESPGSRAEGQVPHHQQRPMAQGRRIGGGHGLGRAHAGHVADGARELRCADVP